MERRTSIIPGTDEWGPGGICAMIHLPWYTWMLEAWPHRLLCQLLALFLGKSCSIGSQLRVSSQEMLIILCFSLLLYVPRKILLPVSRKSFSFWSFFKILRQCPGFFFPLEISDFIKESHAYRSFFVCPSFCLILAMNNEHPEGDLLTGVVREGRSSSRK